MIVYYDEGILSQISALRAYYGLDSYYQVDEKVAAYLNDKQPSKIFLLLIDGMGQNLIERKLSKNSFLRQNLFKKTTTVFPPTTVAATTAILSGKAPNETAWLGWMTYVEDLDDTIIPFYGRSYYTEQNYGSDYLYKLLPYNNIVDELNARGIKARDLYPSFKEDGCNSLSEMTERLAVFSNESDYQFIYAYWDEYDGIMHELGPDAKKCDDYLLNIDKLLNELAQKLADDTLLLVVADHGQVTINELINLYQSKYEKYFYRKPALEFRAMTFYIKEEYKEEFAKVFKSDYEKDFVLLTKEEVEKLKIFGPNNSHPYVTKILGDYLAIGKSDKYFIYDEHNRPCLRGQHAGMCDDELYIPFVMYQKC